jgi:hypothetical protein
MKIKRKIFNFLSMALITLVTPMLYPWSSVAFFGESEIPEKLME